MTESTDHYEVKLHEFFSYEQNHIMVSFTAIK